MGWTRVGIQGCNDALVPQAWVECIGRVCGGLKGKLLIQIGVVSISLCVVFRREWLKILFAGHGCCSMELTHER